MELTLRISEFLDRCFHGQTIHLTGSTDAANVPAEPDFKVRFSNPAGLWSSPRLTQVVEVQHARMIYLSGQAAADANYKVHSSDFRAQAHAVYDNIETALAAVGATLHNIVKTTTYLTDAGNLKDLREVRLARYKDLRAPPANTLLVVNRLAETEFLIEIDVVAALPMK